jgi:hypothetical protein
VMEITSAVCHHPGSEPKNAFRLLQPQAAKPSHTGPSFTAYCVFIYCGAMSFELRTSRLLGKCSCAIPPTPASLLLSRAHMGVGLA